MLLKHKQSGTAVCSSWASLCRQKREDKSQPLKYCMEASFLGKPVPNQCRTRDYAQDMPGQAHTHHGVFKSTAWSTASGTARFLPAANCSCLCICCTSAETLCVTQRDLLQAQQCLPWHLPLSGLSEEKRGSIRSGRQEHTKTCTWRLEVCYIPCSHPCPVLSMMLVYSFL